MGLIRAGMVFSIEGSQEEILVAVLAATITLTSPRSDYRVM